MDTSSWNSSLGRGLHTFWQSCIFRRTSHPSGTQHIYPLHIRYIRYGPTTICRSGGWSSHEAHDATIFCLTTSSQRLSILSLIYLTTRSQPLSILSLEADPALVFNPSIHHTYAAPDRNLLPSSCKVDDHPTTYASSDMKLRPSTCKADDNPTMSMIPQSSVWLQVHNLYLFFHWCIWLPIRNLYLFWYSTKPTRIKPTRSWSPSGIQHIYTLPDMNFLPSSCQADDHPATCAASDMNSRCSACKADDHPTMSMMPQSSVWLQVHNLYLFVHWSIWLPVRNLYLSILILNQTNTERTPQWYSTHLYATRTLHQIWINYLVPVRWAISPRRQWCRHLLSDYKFATSVYSFTHLSEYKFATSIYSFTHLAGSKFATCIDLLFYSNKPPRSWSRTGIQPIYTLHAYGLTGFFM